MENKYIRMALEIGFSHAGKLNTEALEFRPEVREMCASGKCHAYGKSWSCPPYCGSLEEISEKAAAYADGIIVQTTGNMEDDFDIECMQETEARHKKMFALLAERMRADIASRAMSVSFSSVQHSSEAASSAGTAGILPAVPGSSGILPMAAGTAGVLPAVPCSSGVLPAVPCSLGIFPMAAGTCTVCKKCTCPVAPCRFPEKRMSSMEACGLVVSHTCESSGMKYYYGKGTITYTSCILF